MTAKGLSVRKLLTWGLALLAPLSVLSVPITVRTQSASAPRVAGHIAYVGPNGNIYEARPDGAGTRALTSDGSAASPYAKPLWSTNGSALLAIRFATGLGAFRSSGPAGLWLISTSGGARRLTTDVPRGYAWASDGHTVVYEQGYLAESTLVSLDTRTGRRRTEPCDPAFRLIGVTPVGNRALGVLGNDLAAESLSDGTTRRLTAYGTKPGVWQGVAALAPSGRTLLYAATPGTRLISLDLHNGSSVVTSVSAPVTTIALSTARDTYAYTMGAPGGVTGAVLHAGKTSTGLTADMSLTTQSFAPNRAALVYTSGSTGSPGVFVARLSCPTTCASRLGSGRDAAWGP